VIETIFCKKQSRQRQIHSADLIGLPVQGCALVVVTHDIELAARADKVISIAGNRPEVVQEKDCERRNS